MATTVDVPSGLGPALRAVRRARSLSLSDVAAATGISASFLSLVENGKSDITIGRLVRLVSFYELQLADLLPAAAPADPDVVRRSEQRTLPSPGEGIRIRLLSTKSQRAMLPMIVEFDPGAHLAEPGRHPGEEFVHVLRGRLVLEVEGSEPRILQAGDSAHYSAERPHLFRNASDTAPLRLICVDSPPNV
jgi:quercetin dioxygenase-like cupin family protein/DNA-binding Xre family transcriptional regulator